MSACLICRKPWAPSQVLHKPLCGDACLQSQQSLGKWRQKNLKFKTILSYMVSLRLYVSKKGNEEEEEGGKEEGSYGRYMKNTLP